MQDTGADLRKLRQAKAEQYARRGKKLTPKGVDQELVAEYVEKYLLTDEQSIRQLVKENRTLGTRIMNWVDSMLAKLGNKDAQERQFLLNAEIEDSDGKATQKRTEFARWVYEQDLTPGQESVVKDSFTFFSHIPADGGRYEDFVEMGVDEGTAYDIATEIGMLEPMDGKETVSSTQKWRVVVDSGLTPVEQLTALKAVTSENEYRKFSVAYDMGVLPEAFVSAKETLTRYDEDGNGSYKNAEIEAALDSIGNTAGIMLPTVGGSATLTNAQRAVLWQLLTGSTSAKNNPYSTSIGWDVIEAMNEAKESGGGISLTGGGISLTGGIVLPEA